MLRILIFSAAVFVLAQGAAAAPPAVDGTTDQAAAVEALNLEAASLSAFSDEIAAALANKDNYVFGNPIKDWTGFTLVTRVQVETFVRYLQVANLLHPDTLDTAIVTSANALKIPKSIVDLMLKDRAAVLATGGAEVAHKALKSVSDKNRAVLTAAIQQLDAEAAGLLREAKQIGAAATWPPEPKPAEVVEEPKQVVFAPAMLSGMRVDVCLYIGSNCGQPAADMFCKTQGLTSAVNFQSAPFRPTFVLGANQVCNESYCNGLVSVTCQ